jgi:hypothetical protein
MVKWVRVNRFCELTGFTADSVQKLIAKHKWIEGQQYRKVNGCVFVNLDGYEKWVEKQ